MVGLEPAGRLVKIHPPDWFLLCALAEAGREAAEQRLRVTFGNELVARGTSFGLRAFRGQQVTEARRAANQLTRGGYLEALGNGLFGLLHG